jgi:hypothetical protein
MIRIEVKLAASMPVWVSAERQIREFPAKASIANKERRKTRVVSIGSPMALIQKSANISQELWNSGAFGPPRHNPGYGAAFT